MTVIKQFKFAANLEYAHSVLTELKIPHTVDGENLNISADENEKDKILQILTELKLDENDVDVDENFQKDFDDWHSNSLNPGHFTGGRIPFFFWNKKNYPFIFFTIFFVPFITFLVIFFTEDGKIKLDFDLYNVGGFFIYLFVAISMIVQWLRYKNKK